MLKTIDIVLIAVMISAAAWTFKVKYEAELIETEIAAVDRKISLERETIALLEADWSLLNQPSRLQHLADTFKGDLTLLPTRPEAIIEATDLPAQPINLVPNQSGVLGGYADSSKSVVR